MEEEAICETSAHRNNSSDFLLILSLDLKSQFFIRTKLKMQVSHVSTNVLRKPTETTDLQSILNIWRL